MPQKRCAAPGYFMFTDAERTFTDAKYTFSDGKHMFSIAEYKHSGRRNTPARRQNHPYKRGAEKSFLTTRFTDRFLKKSLYIWLNK